MSRDAIFNEAIRLSKAREERLDQASKWAREAVDSAMVGLDRSACDLAVLDGERWERGSDAILQNRSAQSAHCPHHMDKACMCSREREI